VLAARGEEVRAAEPAQSSPGHGGRVLRREEKSGGERKGASSPRRRGTPGETRHSDGGAREAEGKARRGGNGEVEGEKLGEGRGFRPILEASWVVAPLETRTGVSREKHGGRRLPDARTHPSSGGGRRTVHERSCARRARHGWAATGAERGTRRARAGPPRARIRGAGSWATMGGPMRGEGALGRAGGGKREGEGGGVGRLNGPGKGGS
jgi:hypothetical protein